MIVEPVQEMFPVLTRAGANDPKVYFPWAIVAKHEKQADRNHGQTLRRLAERGGLAPCELVAVLEDRAWHRMKDEDAWRAIYKHVIADV